MLIKAVGIVSPLVSFPAKVHHQVFGIFAGQRGQRLAIWPSLTHSTPMPVVGWASHARVNEKNAMKFRVPGRRFGTGAIAKTKGADRRRGASSFTRLTRQIAGPWRLIFYETGDEPQ